MLLVLIKTFLFERQRHNYEWLSNKIMIFYAQKYLHVSVLMIIKNINTFTPSSAYDLVLKTRDCME